MFDANSRSSAQRKTVHRRACCARRKTSKWICCIALVLACGCATPMTAEGPNLMSKTAAKAKLIRTVSDSRRQSAPTADSAPSNENPIDNQHAKANPVASPSAISRPQHALPQPATTSEVAQVSYQQPVAQGRRSAAQGSPAEMLPGPAIEPEFPGFNPAQDSLANTQMGNPNGYPPDNDQASQPNGYRQIQPDRRAWTSNSNTSQFGPGSQPLNVVQPNPTAGPSAAAQEFLNHPQPGSPSMQFADSPTMAQPLDHRVMQGNGTGHLVDGMNLYGSELRQRTLTASEVALHLKDQNELLKREIHALQAHGRQLALKIEEQKKQLQQSRENLLNEQRQSDDYRKLVAKLNVKIQSLEQEKVSIEQDADRALREIESTLDTLLLDSVTNARESSSGGRTPN